MDEKNEGEIADEEVNLYTENDEGKLVAATSFPWQPSHLTLTGEVVCSQVLDVSCLGTPTAHEHSLLPLAIGITGIWLALVALILVVRR